MELYLLLLSVAIGSTLLYMTPLIFASMGSIFSELSGIVNIGIDGMMTFGAFVGISTAFMTNNPWYAFIAAGIGGAVFGLLHAFACIHLHADHTVSGIAINFLAPALSTFLCQYMFQGSYNTPPIPLDAKMPKILSVFFDPQDNAFLIIIDNIFNHYFTTVMALVLVAVVYFVINKTRFGMRLRACGEHPEATASLGINVYKIRYIAVIISGILAAFGGAAITLATVSTYRPGIVSGQGYIAIAAVIFGKYKPLNAMGACILFGFCNAMTVFLGNPKLGFNIPPNILSLIPYIITLVALFIMGRSYAPKASGKLYYRSR